MKFIQINVIDDNICVVLLTPLLGKGVVKPGVERGDKVAPLRNLQRLLLCGCALRKQKSGAEGAGSNAASAGQFDEISSRYTLSLLVFFLHLRPPQFSMQNRSLGSVRLTALSVLLDEKLPLFSEPLDVFWRILQRDFLASLHHYADLLHHIRVGQRGHVAGIHLVGNGCQNAPHDFT